MSVSSYVDLCPVCCWFMRESVVWAMARASGAASDAGEGDVMTQRASSTQQSWADVRAREVEGLVAMWTAAGLNLGLRPMPPDVDQPRRAGFQQGVRA